MIVICLLWSLAAGLHECLYFLQWDRVVFLSSSKHLGLPSLPGMPQGETHCSTVHLSPLTCWRVSWSWSSFPCPKASINEQHICQEDHLWILIWCAVLDASSNDQCCHLGCVAGAVFACGDLRCLLLSTWVLHKHSSSSVPHSFYCRPIYVCLDPWSLRELYFRDNVGAFLQSSLCLCWELDLKTWIHRTDT